MPFYLYFCQRCNQTFEARKPMSDSSKDEDCPTCGQKAERRYAPVPASFGWRLSDESNEIGHKDEWIRDI